MKIPGTNSTGPLRPARAKNAQTQPMDPIRDDVRTQSETARSDRVEISSAGRAKAAVKLEPTSPEMSHRLAEVRNRVLSGAYDNNEVVGEVARRILDRGEV